jgi:putative hydroxymethylpyrimidine transporter CytX
MNRERKIGGFSFFTLWFGAAVSLAEIMTGSLIAPLGLKKGIIIIILGHLAGCLIFILAGIIGFNEKKPALLSSRFSLGKYGSYIISIFNIIQLTGWTAIMLIQCAKSLQSITGNSFIFSNPFFFIIISGILVAVWALFANKRLSLINNLAVIMLAILSMVILFVIFNNGSGKNLTAQGDAISAGFAFELCVVMPLSWIPLISDYTMAGKTRIGSAMGSFTGYFLGSSLMYIIGLLCTLYTGSSDPFSILVKLNMGIPALLVVLFATVTTAFMDVYSAAVSASNIFPKFSKNILILIYALAGTILALFFPMEKYQDFLYLIGSIFAPVFSVIFIDYFLFRKDRSGSFLNISGILCAACGTTAYYFINKFDLLIGSSIPSMIVTMVLYITVHYILKIVKQGEYKDA